LTHLQVSDTQEQCF